MLKIDEKTEAFIRMHLHDNVNDLYLKTVAEGIDLDFAVHQINGRLKGPKKLPSWQNIPGILYPSRLALEQCSSEQTGRYKSKLINGSNLLDMTGGFGVDTYFLSKQFEQVDYFESNIELFGITKHNLSLLGCKNINFHNEDSVHFLKQKEQKYSCIYIDPYRRDTKKKRTFFIEDCSPNILEIQDLLLDAADEILIKFSPMLDIDLLMRQLKCVRQIHVVAVKNECKELLVLMAKNQTAPTSVTATDIYPEQENSFTSLFAERHSTTMENALPADHLYEPNRAILKAGLQDKVALEFGFKKMAPHSHLYTSSQLNDNFPGRVFKIHNIIKPKLLKKYLPEKKANIIVRNYPLKADEIHQKYKIKSGGDQYVIGTTLEKGERVFILAERLLQKT